MCLNFALAGMWFLMVASLLACSLELTVGSGICSWYGDEAQGDLTANGERFNKNDLTAAHRTLPFGTRIRVTNNENGKTVVVRINDRGPFVAGRILDLSEAAFRRVANLRKGLVRCSFRNA